MGSRAEEPGALGRPSLWGDFSAAVAIADLDTGLNNQQPEELPVAAGPLSTINREAVAIQPNLWPDFVDIRPLEKTGNDFEQFCSGFESVLATHTAAFHLEAPLSFVIKSILRKWFLDPGVVVLGGKLDGMFVGAVAVERDARNPSECEIGFLYRRAEARGRGVGCQLLRAAIYTVMQPESVTSVSLAVRPENEHAHALYRSAGFVDVEVNDRGDIVMRLGSREEMHAAIRALDA